MLERCFGLNSRGTTLGAEVRGGVTTFMVMAYIIFVNPAILSFAGIPALQGQGAPFAATQAATCLVAGVMTIVMGLVTNYPLAVASGMGLNAVVAFQLIAGHQLPWPAAMGVVFFDTMGTVIGIGSEAGWLRPDGKLPRLKQVLLVDGLAAMAGGLAGASSATTYIESPAGIAAGARTGLASVVTGACFLLALFLAPLAGVVPPQATAPALIVVGYLMCRVVRDIPFRDLEEGFPALLTLVVMPFTYSITNGIGAGFIAFCFIKLVRGKAAEVRPMMYVAAASFVLYFALPALQ